MPIPREGMVDINPQNNSKSKLGKVVSNLTLLVLSNMEHVWPHNINFHNS